MLLRYRSSVNQHRLAGAIEKFNRAKEQFDELRSEMDAFFNKEPKPHTSAGQFDSEAWEWVEEFQILEDTPVRLGVILGDVLHNLRSCLDHIVWQVTLLDGNTPDDRTQFPIASKSEAQFQTMADERIPGLSQEHRAMVQRVQPYHRGDEASLHPLSVLADLSNIDKHRIVHPMHSFSDMDAGKVLDEIAGSYQGEGESPAIGFWMVERGTRLEHGTPWFRITWKRTEEPPRSVHMSGDLTLGKTFGEMGADAADFKKLPQLIRVGILEPFMREFPETQYID
jgi:hypothetical protein